MAFYEDLSDYEFYDMCKSEKILNIGWLDSKHEYRSGKVPDEVVAKILQLCSNPMHRTRGYHLCPFCSKPSFGIEVQFENELFKLGSAEIMVRGQDKTIYMAPDMIYHYITKHNYLPPGEYIRALIEKKLETENKDSDYYL
jgi:hypothetical protein